VSDSNSDYMDPILERKEAEAANRGQRRAAEHGHTAKEQHIEDEEKAQLYGPFKAQYMKWVVIGIVVAFLALIVGAYFVPMFMR